MTSRQHSKVKRIKIKHHLEYELLPQLLSNLVLGHKEVYEALHNVGGGTLPWVLTSHHHHHPLLHLQSQLQVGTTWKWVYNTIKFTITTYSSIWFYLPSVRVNLRFSELWFSDGEKVQVSSLLRWNHSYWCSDNLVLKLTMVLPTTSLVTMSGLVSTNCWMNACTL